MMGLRLVAWQDSRLSALPQAAISRLLDQRYALLVQISSIASIHSSLFYMFYILYQDVKKDKPPPEGRASVEYEKKHKSTRHHCPPLLDIPITRHVPCILHLCLAIARHWWRKAIVESCDTAEKAEKLRAVLQENNILTRYYPDSELSHINVNIISTHAYVY